MYNRFISLIAKIGLILLIGCFFQSSFAESSTTSAAQVLGASRPLPGMNLPSLPGAKPVASAAPATPTAGIVPLPPDFDVKSYILIDANSGTVIANKNANLRVPPASLTKVMTLYLIANALRSGQLHLTDQVTISENAWRTGGSRMFVKVSSSVLVDDLIKGIAIASGNDATVAMAEHLAGSEQVFVNIMNQTARNLRMDNTSYFDSVGFSHENNYSTAYDLAILARAWFLNFPEYYPWFKEKWINYNNIKQPNRNRLLWRDTAVDGIKTGHTEEAGYCLITSAMRGGMRLIAVIMGAKNDSLRANYSMSLLNYGFRFFETHKLFAANMEVVKPKVWFGKDKVIALGLKDDLYLTLPKNSYKNLKANVVINERLKAPIAKGASYGTLNILLNNKIIATKPLIALQENARTNFIFAIVDYIRVVFNH